VKEKETKAFLLAQVNNSKVDNEYLKQCFLFE